MTNPPDMPPAADAGSSTETERRAAANRHADYVGIILAIAIGVALNLFVIATILEAVLLYASAQYPNLTSPNISENATQILTGWGGGMIGVIGALVGIRVGQNAASRS